MKKVPAAILLGYLAISLGCVTFAWMNEPNPPTGGSAYILFNADDPNADTLRIQSRAITCTVSAYDDAIEDYVDLDSFTLGTLFSKSNFVPGKYVPIKFSFTNSSDALTDVSLIAYDVEASDITIFPFIYFGVNREVVPDQTIYYESIIGTYTTFEGAEDQGNGKYSIPLIDKLQIMHTDEDETMDYYCYVMISKNMTSEYEQKSFTLGHFRVIL